MVTTRTRISPLDRISTLNRALDQALNGEWGADTRSWMPAIDVIETKDAFLVYAELPGVDSSEIDMTFEKGVLTLRGAKRFPLDPNSNGNNTEMRIYAAERATGKFERSIRLPEFVNGDRISADFSNGLLTVTVPKSESAQPRRIEINSAVRTVEKE